MYNALCVHYPIIYSISLQAITGSPDLGYTCTIIINYVVYSITVHNDAGDDCISPVEASNSEVVVIASVIPVVIVVLIVVLVIMLGIFVVRSRRQQYKLNLNDNVSQQCSI